MIVADMLSLCKNKSDFVEISDCRFKRQSLIKKLGEADVKNVQGAMRQLVTQYPRVPLERHPDIMLEQQQQHRPPSVYQHHPYYYYKKKQPHYNDFYANSGYYSPARKPLRDRPYSDHWCILPQQQLSNRNTAAVEGSQQQRAQVEEAASPSTTQPALGVEEKSDSPSSNSSEKDVEDDDGNNNILREEDNMRRGRRTAGQLLAAVLPSPSPQDDQQPQQSTTVTPPQRISRRRLTAEAARELIEKREQRSKTPEREWNGGPVTRSKSPHFGLWSPLDKNNTKKTPQKHTRTPPAPVNFDVGAVESDARECTSTVEMITLSDYKKILTGKRRESCHEQLVRLFGNAGEDEGVAVVEEGEEQPEKTDKSKSVVAEKPNVVEKIEKQKTANVVAVVEKTKQTHTVEHEKGKQKRSLDKKHKSNDHHKNKKPHQTKRKPGRILNDDDGDDQVSDDVPSKKQKHIVPEDQIDSLFPSTSDNNSSGGVTVTLNGSDDKQSVLLTPATTPLEVRQATGATTLVPEERVEECVDTQPMQEVAGWTVQQQNPDLGRVLFPFTPEVHETETVERSTETVERSTETMVNKTEPKSEIVTTQCDIIDLTTTTDIKTTHPNPSGGDDDDDNYKHNRKRRSKSYSFCNKSLAVNMAHLIHCAVADRQIFNLATRMFKNTTLTDQQSERELVHYRNIHKEKVEMTCRGLVAFLLDVQDVVDFDVMVFLLALTNEVKQRYTLGMDGKRGKCSEVYIYEVLCTVCGLIEDKKMTPFVEQFVVALFGAKREVEALANNQPVASTLAATPAETPPQPTAVPYTIPPAKPADLIQAVLPQQQEPSPQPSVAATARQHSNLQQSSPHQQQQQQQQPQPFPPSSISQLTQQLMQVPQNVNPYGLCAPYGVGMGPVPPPTNNNNNQQQQFTRQQQQQRSMWRTLTPEQQDAYMRQYTYAQQKQKQYAQQQQQNNSFYGGAAVGGGGGGSGRGINEQFAMAPQVSRGNSANSSSGGVRGGQQPPPTYEMTLNRSNQQNIDFVNQQVLNVHQQVSQQQQQYLQQQQLSVGHNQNNMNTKPQLLKRRASKKTPPKKLKSMPPNCEQQKVIPQQHSVSLTPESLPDTSLKTSDDSHSPTIPMRMNKTVCRNVTWAPPFVVLNDIAASPTTSTTTPLLPPLQTTPSITTTTTNNNNCNYSGAETVVPMSSSFAMQLKQGNDTDNNNDGGGDSEGALVMADEDNALCQEIEVITDFVDLTVEDYCMKEEMNKMFKKEAGVKSERAEDVKETGEILHPDVHNKLCLCGKRAVHICRCKKVMYCSSMCQGNDWSNHMKHCV